MKNSLNGFLLVDKPAGWTSFDVCAKLRKPLGVKRIGHTGTLDPFATGLLVVAVGKCTKLIPLLEKDIKTYRTKIVLGKTSETLDPESPSVECRVTSVELKKTQQMTVEKVQEFLNKNFLGKITQIPPKYSALKIDGKRAYDLARKGEDVVMKERETEVKSIKVLSYSFPHLEVEISVAAGFYVRSFARDVGTALCGGGMCGELCRIVVGEIELMNGECRVSSEGAHTKNPLALLPPGGVGGGGSKLKSPPSVPPSGREVKGKILTEAELKTGNFTVEDYAINPQLLIKNIVHISIDPSRLPDLQAGRAVFFKEELREKREERRNGEKVLVLCEGQTVGLAEVKDGNLQPRVVF